MKTEELLKKSKKAFLALSQLSAEQKNKALLKYAEVIEKNKVYLLRENEKDLKREKGKLSPALYQRLKLDEGKLAQIIQGVKDVASLPDPVNQILAETLLDDGLTLQKVSVPLGVVGVIFESRPDVIPQILALMLKSGNAVVLKGGSEAINSNQAFIELLRELEKFDYLPKHWAELLVSRKAVHEILDYPEYVALIIPRGSNALVQSIMSNTKIPVMGHADGICHLYVDSDADIIQALTLTIDAKTQYPSACNAIETLLVHQDQSKTFLPVIFEAAKKAGLELRGCDKTRKVIKVKTATEKDWSTEYGELILSVKIVASLDEAVEHIHKYGSAHTDVIVSRDTKNIEDFLNRVDSAGVFANASSRFADGFRYGFGAEVGISTGKVHARGPVGLEGLAIYKYKIRGKGHCVSTYAGEKAKAFKHKKIK